MRLHDRKLRPPVLLGSNLHVVELVRVHGACTKGAYLARTHQLIERFE